jgi:hypothetical protein
MTPAFLRGLIAEERIARFNGFHGNGLQSRRSSLQRRAAGAFSGLALVECFSSVPRSPRDGTRTTDSARTNGRSFSQIKEGSSKQGGQENRRVAEVNPTPSNRRIEGRQRGHLEIVATRWTELRRNHVSVCEICEHRKCVGVARGKAVGWDPPFASEYQIPNVALIRLTPQMCPCAGEEGQRALDRAALQDCHRTLIAPSPVYYFGRNMRQCHL